jgi:FkbM family methyltransferase
MEGLDNVEILPYAASNGEHTAMISDAPIMPMPGRQTLHGTGEGGSVVQCYRLDDLIDKPVHVLKIDVEMHEMECLEGATRILEVDHPDIIIEVKQNLRGTEFDPRPLIEQAGYKIRLKTGQDFWCRWEG